MITNLSIVRHLAKVSAATLLITLFIGCSTLPDWLSSPEQRYQSALDAKHFRRAIDIASRARDKALATELKAEQKARQGEGEQAEPTVQTEAEAGQQDEDGNAAQNPQTPKGPELASEHWQQKLAQAESAATQFQQQQITEIDRMLGEDDWLPANQAQRFMQRHLPTNEVLQRFNQRFEKIRGERINSLQRSLLLLDSQSIPEQLQLHEKLHAADDQNKSYRKSLEQIRERQQQAIQSLEQQVSLAETDNDLNNALVYARALQRLQDSPDVLARIAAIRQELGARTAVKTRHKAVLTERQKEQLNVYGKAIVEQRWVDARGILDAMLVERPADGELLGQDTYLKEIFQSTVAEARSSGEQLYAAGKIEEALEVWQSVVPMAPDDVQLAANIERAQRILNKVEALKKTDQNQDVLISPAVEAR